MSISIAEYKALKPRRAKPFQAERVLQKQCVYWFKVNYPNLIIHHSPNGGKRDLNTARHFKEMGTLAGFPDLFIAEPCGEFHGLFIEMKSDKGTLTENQKKIMPLLDERKYKTAVVKDLDEFIEIVKGYFGGMLK